MCGAGTAWDGRSWPRSETTVDSGTVLPTIPLPVLIVSGTRDRFRDRFIPPAVIERAAALTGLRGRPMRGKGHLGTGSDERVGRDVLAFAGGA